MITKSVIESINRVTEPITAPVTKFGGQPVWLTEPQWPLSSGWDNRPMMFVGQIVLDKELFPGQADVGPRMAYIFVTHTAHLEDDFFDPDIGDPDGGENEIIIQPYGSPRVETAMLENGPSLWDHDELAYEGSPVLKQGQDPEFIDSETYLQLSVEEQEAYTQAVEGDKIAGTPYFFQGDGWPEVGKWKLVLQLNGNFKPFYLNIGAASMLFAFISEDFTTGKLLIQDT